MVKVLFDLESTQPNMSGKRHGGGKYGEIVLSRIVERGLPVSVYYNSTKWLNPQIKSILEKSKIQIYDVSEKELDDIVKTTESDVLYTPLLSNRSAEVKSCKVIATLHGLRSYETASDIMMLKYRGMGGFRMTLRTWVLMLFPQLNDIRLKRLKKADIFIKNKIDYVTVSNHSAYSIKTYFPEINFDVSKTFYSPSTVQKICDAFRDRDKYFLLVSGNRWEKNNLRALIALDKLYEIGELTDYKVVITGSSTAKDFIYEFKNLKRFNFVGYVDENELAQLYHDAYCLIYPSLNEGFGYPPLEAMANGVPVIASPNTSIQEVCQSAALYTNPYSIEEIMTRILMMCNEEVHNEYSRRSRERYPIVKEKQDFDLDKLIDYLYRVI